MHALHASYRRSGVASDLEVYPHLWAGVGLVRGGAAARWSAATSRWPT
jgi:alkanesulfonate monooxygenase